MASSLPALLMSKRVGSKSLWWFWRLNVCFFLSQIQLVDDGADTTSPETPEPGTGKVPKRGKEAHVHLVLCLVTLQPVVFSIQLCSNKVQSCRSWPFSNGSCPGDLHAWNIKHAVVFKSKEKNQNIECSVMWEHARKQIAFLWQIKIDKNSTSWCMDVRAL